MKLKAFALLGLFNMMWAPLPGLPAERLAGLSNILTKTVIKDYSFLRRHYAIIEDDIKTTDEKLDAARKMFEYDMGYAIYNIIKSELNSIGYRLSDIAEYWCQKMILITTRAQARAQAREEAQARDEAQAKAEARDEALEQLLAQFLAREEAEAQALAQGHTDLSFYKTFAVNIGTNSQPCEIVIKSKKGSLLQIDEEDLARKLREINDMKASACAAASS